MAIPVIPYVAFLVLCLLFGTSYAFVSQALRTVDGNMLSFWRMWSAFIAAFTVFAFRFLTDTAFRLQIKASYSTGAISFPKVFLCGILNQGLPHSLITIAQRSVPSVAVTISQPCVSLFALFAAHFLLKDERFHWRKLIPQLFALSGTFLTSLPTLSSKAPGVASPQSVDFGLLAGAICSFGIGTVYVKVALVGLDMTFCSAFQLLASALYTSAFAVYQLGFDYFVNALRTVNWEVVKWAGLLGVVFSYTSGLLFVYVIRTLGAVKAGFANFGQIVVGVVAGVVFLNEWAGYSRRDLIMSFIGLGLLTLSIFSGFFMKEKSK
jgi:drug/metabolite transporter (DMT)-like permease